MSALAWGAPASAAAGPLHIVKLTNGADHNSPPGLVVPQGAALTFTYLVTSATPLVVWVEDDNGTGGFGAGSFVPTFVGGDTNNNGLVDPDETWTYSASAIAAMGPHSSTATVGDSQGEFFGTDVETYFGTGGIELVKTTNGTSNDTAPGLSVADGTR